MKQDLTKGNLAGVMLRFCVPYLIASFLQSFYGLADLFITGQFNGAASISAVSIGSQVMHMLTVVLVGLAMGTTVTISRAVGAKDEDGVRYGIGSTISLFAIVAVILTAALLLLTNVIISALSTPAEAVGQTRQYLLICFAGVPFIIAYNVISSIFRGLGDTKSPMYFVAAAGLFNIVLDYVLIGAFSMQAAGAAAATVIAQAASVLIALFALKRTRRSAKDASRRQLRTDSETIKKILRVGLPIAVQEGLIQISFLAITAIANSRGVDVAAAVGIVEKMISFLFLVHSAMLSTVSAVAAQNAGAGDHERSRRALYLGCMICFAYGLIIFILCQPFAEDFVAVFTKNDPHIAVLGAQYLRSYSLDCVFAGIHFCFSGYFSAYGKSVYSFIHNILSVVLVRVPGAYLAAALWPATLWPMGLAAPMGSFLSVLICVYICRRHPADWQ